MYEHLSEDLLAFIRRSPSTFHVIANMGDLLSGAGFERLSETDLWSLAPGGRYFVTRNDSSLIAFTVPFEEPQNIQIAAAHSDSPAFRLKYDPELKAAGRYIMLNVEQYGGAVLSPWLDRPLSVAGRVILREADHLESRLVNIDRDLVLIPNLAIHMNRDISRGYTYQIQRDMLPLFGDEADEGAFLPLIAEAAHTRPDRLLSADLYLYSRTSGSIWGARRQYLSSGRLDDLQCAYPIVRSLAESQNSRHSLLAAAIFDNEEVGSRTKQGADSPFLADTLERAADCLGMTRQQYRAACANGFMISADNAHALHPQHPDKADPIHRPLMNQGPVMKFSASQKYTTDACSAAIFRMLCDRAGVPCQTFYNHSDQPGGSTLGNLSNAHLALPTVDIGLPQLAMHSPCETAGVQDTLYLMQVLKEFYQVFIHQSGGLTLIS